MTYDDTIPQQERAQQNAKDDRADLMLEIQNQMQKIEHREPLMFDGESAHGVAVLTALATFELEIAVDPTRWPVTRQVEQVEYMIEALRQYALQLTEPDCPQCGADLTAEPRNAVGRPTHCPACDRTLE